jgi:hypothetical protein
VILTSCQLSPVVRPVPVRTCRRGRIGLPRGPVTPHPPQRGRRPGMQIPSPNPSHGYLRDGPGASAWQQLFTATIGPPPTS